MKRKRTIIAVLTAAVLLSIFLIAARTYENGAYERIYTLKSTDAMVLRYQKCTEISFVFLNDGNTTMLTIDASGKPSEHSFDFHAVKVSFDGERFNLFYELDGKVVVRQIESSSMEQRDMSFDVAFDALDYYGISENTLYYSLYDAPTNMHKLEENGEGRAFRFEDGISYIGCRAGKQYAYAEGSLFVFEGGNLSEFLKLEQKGIPFTFLDDERFISLDGDVFALQSNALQTVVSCGVAPSEYAYHYLEADRLAYVVNKDEIDLLSTSTGETEKYHIDGDVKAVSTTDCIVQREKELYLTSLATFAEKQEPSQPEEEAEKSEFPENVEVEGDYFYIELGTTIKQLRADMKEDIIVTNEKGNIVNSGVMRTGYKVKGKYAVIMGDTNGSGTINGADVKEGQFMLLGSSTRSAACFKAADINKDDEITTTDLVFISKLAAKYGD